MKKALLFDPYLDTLGGGERYFISFACVLRDLGFEVHIAWSSLDIRDQIISRFNLNLDSIQFDATAYSTLTTGSFIARAQTTRDFDLVFWVSDGSIPTLFAAKNFLHFQVPFSTLNLNLVSKFKLATITSLIYNSNFTQSVIAPQVSGVSQVVLYPPIDVDSLYTPTISKLPQILSVARFGSPLHSKRQDVLIEAFRIFSKQHPNYRLILAGGLSGSDESAIDKLRSQAAGLPVEFIINPSYTELVKHYQSSTFFWHAAGFEIDESLAPERVEHFGMTTVEAMAAGCVPVVISKGGQREILRSFPQLLVDSPLLMAESTSILATDTSLYSTLQSKLIAESAKYSLKCFADHVRQII